MSKKTRNIILVYWTVSFIIIMSVLILITIFLVTDGGTKQTAYDKDNYYQMESTLTEDNIQFYVHDNNLYLSDKFDEPVGSIYKEEDGSGIYIVYNTKKYMLSSNDTKLFEVKPSVN